jgi:hypothetical protein
MQKYLQGALFATVAGALTFGAAASLNVHADNLGGGAVGVVSCDADVDVSFAPAAGEPELVGAIVISNIDAACEGQTATVSVSNLGSAILATGSETVAGDTLTVPLTSAPQAAQIAEVSVTITGAAVIP